MELESAFLNESPRFQHFLMTRFNVGLYPKQMDQAYSDKQGRVPAKDPDGWMEKRFELFERFCVPSVRNQSMKDFTWLVVFDAKTPQRYLDRAERVGHDCHLVPQRAERGHRRTLRLFAAQSLRPDTKYLITSRIDNDDAIHRDFVGTVQGHLRQEAPMRRGSLARTMHKWLPDGTRMGDSRFKRVLRRLVPNQGRIAINFTLGFAFDGERLALFSNERNSFISLLERTDLVGGVLTAWATEHKRIRQIATVREIATEPMWVRVIHDENLRNEFEGEEVPMNRLTAADFGFSP